MAGSMRVTFWIAKKAEPTHITTVTPNTPSADKGVIKIIIHLLATQVLNPKQTNIPGI